MWLLVDTNFGLMDGFYCKETYSEERVKSLCDHLNKRFPGSNFIPTFTETRGARISDFCMHNSVSHVPKSLYESAMTLRTIRSETERPVVVLNKSSEQMRISDTTSVEDAVLGSILLSTKLPENLILLKNHHFIDNRNKYVFGLICLSLQDQTEFVLQKFMDLFTSRRREGDVAHLAKLVACVPNAAHCEYYISQLIIDRNRTN